MLGARRGARVLRGSPPSSCRCPKARGGRGQAAVFFFRTALADGTALQRVRVAEADTLPLDAKLNVADVLALTHFNEASVLLAVRERIVP